MAEKNELLEEMAVPDGSGGQSVGFHGKVTVKLGFSFFAAGVSAADVFQPYELGDAKSKETAQKAAQKLAAEHGKNASKGVLLVIHQESVKVRTLKADMAKVTLQWNAKSYKAWMEALATLGVTKLPLVAWAHVKAIPNPDGRMQKTDEGERPDTFWVLDAVYKTEQECTTAAQAVAVAEGDTVGAAPAEKAPDGYSPQDWAKYKAEIISACGNFAPPVVKKVSDTYAITVDFLMQYKPA